MAISKSEQYDLLDRLIEEFTDRFRRGERPAFQGIHRPLPRLGRGEPRERRTGTRPVLDSRPFAALNSARVGPGTPTSVEDYLIQGDHTDARKELLSNSTITDLAGPGGRLEPATVADQL
jgi:hypothetical protein